MELIRVEAKDWLIVHSFCKLEFHERPRAKRFISMITNSISGSALPQHSSIYVERIGRAKRFISIMTNMLHCLSMSTISMDMERVGTILMVERELFLREGG